MKKLLFFLMLILLCSSCITTLEEAYNSFHGRAEIISIKQSQYNPAGKNQYVDIFFNFTPDDAQAPSSYRYKDFSDSSSQLFYDHIGNHLKTWVAAKSIKKGNVYRAIRYERRGSSGGAPVFFDVYIDQGAVK
jgi:hypothetical protein